MNAVCRRLRRWSRLSRLLPRVCVLLAVFGAEPAVSQQVSQVVVNQYSHGFFVQAPSDVAYSKRNDLQLTVDSRWPNNFGYRPVRVRIVANRPTATEHRIRIRLRVAAREQPAIEVDQTADMPQGATEFEFVVRVPRLDREGVCRWDVWVDGVRDPELCVDESTAWDLRVSGNPISPGTSFACVVVESDARPGSLRTTYSSLISAVTFSPADLPTRWIDYNSVDVVVVTPEVLESLEATRSEALTALRQWVRTGGQLWLHSAGENWNRLAAAERILRIDSLRPLPTAGAAIPEPANDSDRKAIAHGWQPLPIGGDVQASRPATTGPSNDGISSTRDSAIDMKPQVAPDDVSASAAITTDSSRWYLEHPVGFGRVRAYRGEWDPIGFSLSWQLLGGRARSQPSLESPPPTPVTVAVESTTTWPERHGLTPDLANADFADFLIPGVGLAPVSEFRVLITLFVLAIGPLNYWLLMRVNRLHLLLFTVPALALGLTGALFGYALLSDGLATRVRVRSFTVLDQATGEAACWARLSYYAGLAPGDGLELDDGIAFYPILSGWDGPVDDETNDARTFQWRDEKQRLAKGWLRSRVPTQFLSVRARKSPARVQIERDDTRLSAANELGTRIEYLAVVDESGEIFVGEGIDNDAHVELQSSTHSDVLRVLRELIVTNQPQMPPELAGSYDRESIVQAGRQRSRRPADSETVTQPLSENLLDTAIADLVAPTAAGVVNEPPRSYVAVTSTGPEVDLGLADVEEEASFHLLLGNW